MRRLLLSHFNCFEVKKLVITVSLLYSKNISLKSIFSRDRLPVSIKYLIFLCWLLKQPLKNGLLGFKINGTDLVI